MSYLKRINNPITGGKSIVKQMGWIGDSICVANYFGPTGAGATNQKYSFASVVSSYYGAYSNNQAESGRVLSSFLPVKYGKVDEAVPDFDGQWLNDNGSWYWWNPELVRWVYVVDSGSSVNRNGTSTAKLEALINNKSVKHVFIAQSGVNDNQANTNVGKGDFDAHGSFHYFLLQNEIIERLHKAGKVAIVVTGTTAADPDFHGTEQDARQEEIGRYSESARQSAIQKGVMCCDVGVRLNIEMALGRVDILCRNSQNKPSSMSQDDWQQYLAATGDSAAASNPYRSFDESEDFMHLDDQYRASYFHNLHPNPFGHYLIANEIIKFVNENGLR
ncbi:hypothetical protein VV97_16305 [Vibrio vulnificus]|uniref:SGNH/GDSL hydrolase family protein n=1 Tax=Vibrio vulnificus TaxID=672 RepID=UPI000D72879F|nr:SGNH/GDSL hydrolase family protein [Vibrio vulnificus]PWY28199.1 hypothetical protein VV97_16305 [Vibrio vulnificus]